MAFADTQKLVVELDLKGNLRSGLQQVQRDLRGFDKATSRTQKSLSKFGSNITKTVAIGAAAITAGGIAIVNAASDYESAFAGVRKTVDATDAQLEELSKQFRALSKEIPISAAELARLGEAGGALGIPIEQMEEFVRVTALLGVTTDLTADDAANSLGILSNVLHLTGEEYDNFASSLVALGNAGASTESQIIAIAERAGAAGELIGVSTEQILGFSSAVASLGIEPEAGGTALQKFFIDAAKQIAEGGDELKLFAKVAGTSAKQFKKVFDKDAGGALQRFLAGLGELSQGEQLAVLEDLGFNDARITRTLLGLANNTKLVADQQKIANDAFRDATALSKEAEQRFKTFDSQLQITKNVLTDMAITIGSKLLPKITPLLKRLNDFISANQGQIEKFGDDLASAFEKVADNVSKVDWQAFIDGLKFAADVGRSTIGIFQSMPDWLQKLIVAGFAVNKFTGGLVTSLGKDLAGALGSQFLGRGSSPANPLWVTSVGGLGGPGLPGGAGGAGGGVKGAIASAAKTAAIVVPPLVIAAELQPEINKAILGDNVLTNPDRWLPPAPDPKPFWELMFRETPKVNNHLGRVLSASAEAASRQNVTNERLEAIKGFTAAQTVSATSLLRSSERNEAIATAKADQIKAQLAAGDTRTELAIAGSKNAITAGIRDTRAETAAVKNAVINKDLSVTNNISVPVNVSVRENIYKTTTYKKYFTYAS